ncbi:metal ABC transporter substrate-binding protein [Rhodoferax koreense]|uniref:Metal ABC transporter substrate-binding protein n=1 Tax=Rhodoferax koreensis TaxID=1842727 RepID=A0A1P8JWU7_9BURK|nr:metal ABC transporter substrate-binding protein [Rhodoferax koreense]APW38226.1 metal ABC transporter substrate-binding protein [Rhodoferax koreense]
MHPLIRKLLAPLAAATLLMAGTAALADPLPVTASFSILGDLVKVVGGERVNVTTLVGPDEDAHVFEPKPGDAKAILQSRLLVTNGLGFEPWAQKLARSANYKGATVVASKGVKARTLPAEKGHHHAETDPHAWQDPTNTILYVRNIATALTQLDPAGAETFQRNTDAYVKELEALDAWARQQIAALPADKRKVITSHDAFGYFAAHYGLTFLAPQGVSTEAEPSAKEVAELIRQIRREKIKAVFFENMSNPKLLAQLSKDAGVTLGAELYADALSPAGQPGATYLQMMRHNITQLTTGMQQN